MFNNFGTITREFCDYPVELIRNGDLDEIYAYLYTDNIIDMMDLLFQLSYRPNDMHIWFHEDRIHSKYEIRICYKCWEDTTLHFSDEGKMAFINEFEKEVIEPINEKVSCGFSLFYMENENNKTLKPVNIKGNPTIESVSSNKAGYIVLQYVCNYDRSHYFEVSRSNRHDFLDKVDNNCINKKKALEK